MSLLKEALIRTLKSALTSQLSMSWQSRRSDSFKPPARKKLRRKTFFQTGEKRKCFLEPKTTFDVKLEKTVFRQNWRFRTKNAESCRRKPQILSLKFSYFIIFPLAFQPWLVWHQVHSCFTRLNLKNKTSNNLEKNCWTLMVNGRAIFSRYGMTENGFLFGLLEGSGKGNLNWVICFGKVIPDSLGNQWP